MDADTIDKEAECKDGDILNDVSDGVPKLVGGGSDPIAGCTGSAEVNIDVDEEAEIGVERR
ncbi:hypothetical protein FBU30_004557 [Linnemannia zychae]|nr:hypothetical protein FBU30_004557 [Linnemannia zychae]